MLSEGYPESFRGLSQKSKGFNLGFFGSKRGLGFNPGPITAPSERPVLRRQAVAGFEPHRGDLLEIETQIWIKSNTNRTDAHRFLYSCVNTDFKLINYVKTDPIAIGFYGLTKLSHKSDAFKLRFHITNGYPGFNQGLATAPAERPVLSLQAGTGFEPQRGDLFYKPKKLW